MNTWDHAGPGGINYTYTGLPTNYNNSLPFNNTFLLQLDSLVTVDENKDEKLKWVELPNCPGTVTPPKPLAEDLANASTATCKPAAAPAAAAAAI